MRHGSEEAGEGGRQRVGVVASFDFTRRAELLRWVPPEVECATAFTQPVTYEDNRQLVSRLGRPEMLAEPLRELRSAPGGMPAAVAYLCTACTFVGGAAGEAALRAEMTARGVRRALTTSGAVTAALRAVGARRVAVVHPYQPPVDRHLADYLEAAGFEVAGLTSLGLGSTDEVYDVRPGQVEDAVAEGDRPGAEAVFVSCTALPTYDLIPALEDRLGKPVIGANQATAWALLRAVGSRARGHGQHLLNH
ncbi:Asp/Glu racemase [Streptomyces sp. Ru73]|uniref:maleate cis-trans isomerase family protein n=1 Tax=Streptomyces sp. Ru73 TaxID=2080748 RepID=UPI000CDCEA54|nr:Asp/Glu racemase [Streptomyces sp. Ru73]POX36961.1 Asp/Glu racemase [Streptomyces sp. Ru73]